MNNTAMINDTENEPRNLGIMDILSEIRSVQEENIELATTLRRLFNSKGPDIPKADEQAPCDLLTDVNSLLCNERVLWRIIQDSVNILRG